MSRFPLVCVLLLSACNQSPMITPDGGPPPTDAGPPTIQFTVRLVDAMSMAALEGVEICAADRPDVACAMSNADGQVTMRLPPNSELMLRCANNDYGPFLMTWAIGTSDIDAGTFSLLAVNIQNAFVIFSGATMWPATGGVTANIYEDIVQRNVRVEGATVTITPTAPLTYVGTNRMPDPTATATTTGGPGLFYDIPPGEVTVTISHPTRTCTGGSGWPVAGDNRSLRTRVYAGALSNVTFVCPP
jgi:hypothetical protein